MFLILLNAMFVVKNWFSFLFDLPVGDAAVYCQNSKNDETRETLCVTRWSDNSFTGNYCLFADSSVRLMVCF